MGGINIQRVALGGLVAGALIWVVEGIGSMFYMEQMTTALAARNLSMEMDAGMWVLSVVVSLLMGLVLVFLYAAARPRFGAGPRTALIVALAVFVVGYLISLIGYQMMGLFPTGLLISWALLGLIEIVLAAQLGAWLYQE